MNSRVNMHILQPLTAPCLLTAVCAHVLKLILWIFFLNLQYWILFKYSFPSCFSLGGWTLIFRTVLETSDKVNSFTKTYGYSKMFEYKNYHLINLGTIYQLRQEISFKQLRFYCHKKRVGRTLHIMTRLNVKGEMVVRYFSNSTDRPVSCGSFVSLPDDTSIVSQHCNIWSVQGDGNWGSNRYNGNWRIQNEPIYVDVGSKHTMQIVPKSSRSYCDDHWADNVQHSAGDSWFIFVRWFWSIFPKFINFMHRWKVISNGNTRYPMLAKRNFGTQFVTSFSRQKWKNLKNKKHRILENDEFFFGA